MPKVELVPVVRLWLKLDQMHVRPSSESVELAKAGKLGETVVVERNARMSRGNYSILSGATTFKAAKEAGLPHIHCIVEGETWWDDLRGTMDSLPWAAKAHEMLAAGYAMESLVAESHLPRSVVHERLAVLDQVKAEKGRRDADLRIGLSRAHAVRDDAVLFARACKDLLDTHQDLTISSLAIKLGVGVDRIEHGLEMLEAIKTAEAFGKVLGRQEKIQEDNERAAAKHLSHLSHATFAKLYQSGKLDTDKKLSPKERGLILCLEPKCKTWITGRVSRTNTFMREKERFCKKHRKNTYEAHPFHDREGDPIWVGAGMVVMKMQDMELSHILNCISKMESDAEKRERHTGYSKAKTLAESPRYALLVKELKQRDACKLCKGGVVKVEFPQVTFIDGNGKPESHDDITKPPVVDYCACKLGQERKATDAIVKQSKGKDRMAILVLALAFITALLNAPAASPHVMEFLHGVHARLRAIGLL